MRIAIALGLAVFLAACGRPSLAGPSGQATSGPIGAAPVAAITVRSDAIGADGRIAARNTAYGAGLSLPVSWTAVPGAKSYAFILDDPDAPGAEAFVHWLVWNIPASDTQLPEGAAAPAGASEGQNGSGGQGYFGPHPPSGTHHYHLRVFALDRVLALEPGADRDALGQAMRGHVIASGEVVGLSSPP